MSLSSATPILRIFDEAKAKEFYGSFLGFSVDWEHRFGDEFPLYMQVSKDPTVCLFSSCHRPDPPCSSAGIVTSHLLHCQKASHFAYTLDFDYRSSDNRANYFRYREVLPSEVQQ